MAGVGRGPQMTVCGEGQQRQKGGKVQAEPFQPALGIRGSPRCVYPPVCAGAPAQAGREGSPSQPHSRLWGLRQSSGPARNGLGRNQPGWGDPEKWDFSSQDPRQGRGPYS